jgi:ABC-type antimicrobial peptide transport system permease subunit
MPLILPLGFAHVLGLPPFNRALLISTVIGIFVTGMLAAAVPALRASRIDRQRALRQE